MKRRFLAFISDYSVLIVVSSYVVAFQFLVDFVRCYISFRRNTCVGSATFWKTRVLHDGFIT